MKKIIFILLMLLMVFGVAVNAAENNMMGAFGNFIAVKTYDTNTFTDFSATDWYSTYIQFAYERGIINGKGGNKFDPNGDLTIAEAIMLAFPYWMQKVLF